MTIYSSLEDYIEAATENPRHCWGIIGSDGEHNGVKLAMQHSIIIMGRKQMPRPTAQQLVRVMNITYIIFIE